MADPDYYDARAAGFWAWGMSTWIGSGWCSGNGPWQAVDGKLVNVGDPGQGVKRQLPHLGNPGQELCKAWSAHLQEVMRALQNRLRRVRVACGDWSRICTPSVTVKFGTTGVFLDPPYRDETTADMYGVDHAEGVAADVAAWCLEHGPDPRLRIVLCGYAGDYPALVSAGWRVVLGRTGNAYGNATTTGNHHRERIWLSPHCLNQQPRLL